MNMNDATARAELYSRLSEVLGIDHAGTLMAYLPGDEPATKSDLVSLKAELTARFDGRMDALDERIDVLDRRMERFEDKLDERMDGFHHALLTQGSDLRDCIDRVDIHDRRAGGSHHSVALTIGWCALVDRLGCRASNRIRLAP